MAIAVSNGKTLFGIPITNPLNPFRLFRPNRQKSKLNILAPTSFDPNFTPTESSFDPNFTPTESENGSEALSIHDQVLQEPFQDLEKQVELSDSAPIASLRGPFNGMDHKLGPNIKDLIREGKQRAKVDDASSSSSHGGREEEKDIDKGIRLSGEDEDTSKQERAIEILRKPKLVVTVMGFSIAISFSLMTFHNINDMKLGMQILAHLLPFSSVAFFSGIVLQYKCPKKSDIIKLVGYGFFFSAVFGLMAFYLTYYGTALTILFAIITNILLVMTFFEKL